MPEKKKQRSLYLGNTIQKNDQSCSEDMPLTPIEYQFIREYIKTGNATEAAYTVAGKYKSRNACRKFANDLLNKPNVLAELKKIMNELRKENIATAQEVMEYFSSVMRGDIKDQFGLDAPLSERTKAASELAKRTIDIENRRAGEPDQLVAVKLDWKRDSNDK